MYRLDTIRNQINFQKPKLLAGKTVVVTGGSRGIGLAIAVRCAKDGANIAILAKTIKEQPTLPGNLFTIKAPSTQQLIKSKKQVEQYSPYPVIFVTKLELNSALLKLLIDLEE